MLKENPACHIIYSGGFRIYQTGGKIINAEFCEKKTRKKPTKMSLKWNNKSKERAKADFVEL